MSRNENRSFIAFGGVPPVKTGEYTSVPIQKIDSMSWSNTAVNQTATNLPNMLVDSGTTINLSPPSVATTINAACVPAGRQEDAIAICTHPSSMILPEAAAEGSSQCLSRIGAGQEGSYIFGDTFMQEIVAVFEVSEKMELKFAQRLD
ncbi:hypothetical protein Hte_006145 [Hypoxylon texense]